MQTSTPAITRRYLTKSRFQQAFACETKLYYTGKKEYANKKAVDPFMQALAEGGFQVGELAKCYFPDGVQIAERDYEKALAATNDMLRQENIVLFEAAFRYRNLFIRADIVVKRGNDIDLIEVKAKSFSGKTYKDFLNRTKTFLSTKWTSYLYDVAFQNYVLKNSYPDFNISSHLMLADKEATATIEGLNQKFLIKRVNGYPVIEVNNAIADLGNPILKQVCVDKIVEMIHEGKDSSEERDQTFAAYVHGLADAYEQDKRIASPISAKCAKCEFCANNEDEAKGLKSGFKECWVNTLGWTPEQFNEPSVLDIWNFKGKDDMIAEEKYLMRDVEEDDIITDNITPPNGLSTEQRQWLQITKATSKDATLYIDTEGLSKEMKSWTFPLHFIDFETTTVAIPFNSGRKPYEGIAFQFSHHQVNADGTIEHKGQYLNRERGIFPNFDFIRALRNELQKDDGTIFRYANHENTYLNLIYRQLLDSDVADKQELIDFIQSISYSGGKTKDTWTGKRNMVDMWTVLKAYYYHPATNGSNSMKAVLPAILSSCKHLQGKYSKSVYGANCEIGSLNFTEPVQWVQLGASGNVRNPYELLPNIHPDADNEALDLLFGQDELAEGGAAMTAYARMQFTQMSDKEKLLLEKALMKYCELDTLAMVMLWEHWNYLLRD